MKMSSNDKSQPNRELEKLIKDKLNKLDPIELELIDESYKHIGHAGVTEHGGRHYRLTIKSSLFNDISLLERHKLIYSILNEFMQSEIHALSITAKPNK